MAGGNLVTVTGTNLTNATSVNFGGIPATIVSDSGTAVVATDPAGAAGTVDVTVTTVGWDTTAIVAADHFTYASGPASIYAESLAAGALAITMSAPTSNASLQFTLAGGNYTFTDTSGYLLLPVLPPAQARAAISGGEHAYDHDSRRHGRRPPSRLCSAPARTHSPSPAPAPLRPRRSR